MNFGPMNREGGERRLDVAITRARREVMVFYRLHWLPSSLAVRRCRSSIDGADSDTTRCRVDIE